MQVSYDDKYHIQHHLLKVTGQRRYGADVSPSKKTKFLAVEWIVSSKFDTINAFIIPMLLDHYDLLECTIMTGFCYIIINLAAFTIVIQAVSFTRGRESS